MSTTARRSRFDRAHYQQFLASWATYQRLLKDRGDRCRPKYTFFNGRLTIVTPGSPHERLKTRVAGLIEETCTDLRIPFLPFGSTTYLKSEKPRAGTEPDESYYYTLAESPFHRAGDLTNPAFVAWLYTFSGLPVYVHLKGLAKVRLK